MPPSPQYYQNLWQQEAGHVAASPFNQHEPGRFTELAAVLAFDPDRLGDLFGKVTAIQNQHAVIVAQISIDFRSQPMQHGGIIAGPFAQKLLHGAHGIAVRPAQRHHHRFNRFAWQLQQQPMQIGLRPVALLRPCKQGTEDRV